MSEKEMINLIETNNDFNDYIRQYCNQLKITQEEALKHKMIGIIAEYYSTKSE